jgi:flavin-dependent dehydrogenase
LSCKIAGAGISGSYLGKLLEREVILYDDNPLPGCKCAWGAPRSQVGSLLKEVGIDVSDFVIMDVEGAYQNRVYIPVSNFVILDKPRLVAELRKGQNLIHDRFDFSVERDNLVVNATGVPRSAEVYELDSFQEKVIITGAKRGTVYGYINPKYSGYAWLFPLDNEGQLFHHGAACKGTEPRRLMNELLVYYGFEKLGSICNCVGPLHLTDPKKTHIIKNNIVDIGGAAGCVHPITGEGILTSMQSAWLLAKVLKNDESLTLYEQSVKDLLARYQSSYQIFRLMLISPPIAWITGIFDMFKSIENFEPKISFWSALRLIYRILWNLLSPPKLNSPSITTH